MKYKFSRLNFLFLLVIITKMSLGQNCKDVLIERVIKDTQCINCYLIPVIIQTEDDSLRRALVESKSLYKFFRKKGFSFEVYKSKMSLILAEYYYRPLSYKEFGSVPAFIDASLTRKHERLIKKSKCKEELINYFTKTQVEMRMFSIEALKDIVFEMWKWGIGVKLRETEVVFGFNCLGLPGG